MNEEAGRDSWGVVWILHIMWTKGTDEVKHPLGKQGQQFLITSYLYKVTEL